MQKPVLEARTSVRCSVEELAAMSDEQRRAFLAGVAGMVATIASEDQGDIHDSEPQDYAILTSSRFKTWQLGGRSLAVGFCVNSPGGAGYCDGEIVWIADQIIDPARVIEIALHEGMHAVFPWMHEADVGKFSTQLAALIVGVFEAKRATLPTLTPLLNENNAPKLFPDAVRQSGADKDAPAPAQDASVGGE